MRKGHIILCCFILSATLASAQTAFNEEWVQRYNGIDSLSDIGIAVDAQGCVYVAGSTQSSATGFDLVVLRYSPAGAQLWEAGYNGAGNGNDVARGLTTDSDCNVYVTGESATGTGTTDYITLNMIPPVSNSGRLRSTGPPTQMMWPIA